MTAIPSRHGGYGASRATGKAINKRVRALLAGLKAEIEDAKKQGPQAQNDTLCSASRRTPRGVNA